MLDNTAFNLLKGWSTGHGYAKNKVEEDEIKQGKNYYLASLAQVGQLACIGTVIDRIASKIFPEHLKTPTKILCNVVPILSIPIFLLIAAVKQGDYEALASKWNEHMPISLPEELNDRVVAIFKYFAEHAGDVMRVAMFVGTFALLYLEDYAYGSMVLTALLYEFIDQKGWVPRKISLFIEQHMKIFSLIGTIAGGTIYSKIKSAIKLPAHLFPRLKDYVHVKVDNTVHKCFGFKGPTLKEAYSPNVDRKDMSYDEIKTILTAPPEAFSINANHCTKWMTDLSNLPEDKDFTKLQSFFDGVTWKAVLIKGKLKDDDRFIDFLSEQFPDVPKKEFQVGMNIQPYLETLAAKAEKSVDDFVIDWTEQQLKILVEVLSGKRRAKGSQKDLDEGIAVISKIIPFLTKYKEEGKFVDLEDSLLKLAIEGGDYCARGIKRTSSELIRTCLQESILSNLEENNDFDPNADFELKFKQALQDKRQAIVEKKIKEILESRKIPGKIANDTHGFDIYRIYFSIGFIPLTKYELEDVGLSDIMWWKWYENHHREMIEKYHSSLGAIIAELGEVNFAPYMCNLIENNKQLSEDQKNSILDCIQLMNEEEWAQNVNEKSFHHLMLVMLGIEKYQEIA